MTPPSRAYRARWHAIGAAGAIALAGTAALASPARGVTGPVAHTITESTSAPAYRYWSYWTSASGDWQFATSGPAARAPQDGDVEGWRFAVTTAAGDQPPRAAVAGSFDDACGSTVAPSGLKRVALVIDPGLASDAPTGQVPPPLRLACAVVPVEATSATALASVSNVRAEAGIVCGLDGFPTGECAPIVTVSAPPATAPPLPSATGESTPPSATGPSAMATVVAAGGVLAAIAAVIVIRRRRSR